MDSDFAKSQLKKHGWTKGSGLGREESGIKEALKVKLKFDTTGVGHNAADEFTYKWWDHMYQKATDNIQVSNSEEGVTVKQSDEFEISKEKPLKKNLSKSDLLYGRFIKSSTLTNDGIEHKTAGNESDSSSSDSEVDSDKPFSALTDEDLYRICEGRTAHKGARHGLRLNGKLKRIEEQEAGILTPTLATPAGSDDAASNSDDQRVKHKRKKRKKEKLHDNDEQACTEVVKEKRQKKKKHVECDVPEIIGRENGPENSELKEMSADESTKTERRKRKKKHKGDIEDEIVSEEFISTSPAKREKRRSRNSEDAIDYDELSIPSPVKKKKKSKKRDSEDVENDSSSSSPVKKKKKKSKERDSDNNNNDDSSSPLPPKKKKKRKKKDE